MEFPLAGVQLLCDFDRRQWTAGVGGNEDGRRRALAGVVHAAQLERCGRFIWLAWRTDVVQGARGDV